jgi:crotonobetainyl-CoA:carnitine CoA-transferase CaiB-like acyl-CoA transferase
MEANLTVVGEAALEFALTGAVRGPLGNRHRTFAPHGIYPALGQSEGGRDGHEQWIAIAAESEGQWGALSSIAARPEWRTDPRFATNEARKANEDALDAAVAAWTPRSAGGWPAASPSQACPHPGPRRRRSPQTPSSRARADRGRTRRKPGPGRRSACRSLERTPGGHPAPCGSQHTPEVLALPRHHARAVSWCAQAELRPTIARAAARGQIDGLHGSRAGGRARAAR